MPAPKPLQVLVLERLQAALEEIVKGDTYSSTLKGKVFIGRNVFDENDSHEEEDIIIAILENPVPPEERKQSTRGAGSVSGDWALFIQGFVPVEKNPDRFENREAYCVKEDILCRLSELNNRRSDFSGANYVLDIPEITDFKFDRGVVQPIEDRSNDAIFYIPLTIDLA